MNPKEEMMSRLGLASKGGASSDTETNEPEEQDTMGSVISLDEDELPAIKNWKNGETHDIELTVKQVSQGQFEVLEAEEESPAEDKAEGGEENEQS